MKYIMWDVDGTLLLTGGAGVDAMTQVIIDYYFLDAFVFQKSLAGRTDSEIIKEAVKQIRGCFVPAECASLLIRYQMELGKQLPKHKGQVLKNVEKTLQHFCQPDSKYLNCLLTGNIKGGAQQKLHYYGIDKYFSFDHSAFGELSEDRAELARIVWQRLYLENPQLEPQDLIFIGDTPNDALCANAIGAPCIIILEGSHYKKQDFKNCMVDMFLDSLPDDPAEFEKLLDNL